MKPTTNITRVPVGSTTGDPALKCLFTRLSAIALLCICQPIGLQAEVFEDLEYDVVWGLWVSIIKYKGTASELIIPEQIDGFAVKIIDSQAFRNCSTLTSVTIPRSVNIMSPAPFEGCSNLTQIHVAQGNSWYKSMDGVLFHIKGELFQFPPARGGDYVVPDGVTEIPGGAFRNCINLTSITLPDSVSVIGWDAFSGCSSLTDIHVGEANLQYSSIDGVLFDKSGEVLIRYPTGQGGNYTIPGSVTVIYDDAFAGCSGLASVTIPDTVTYIGEGAFDSCPMLTSLIIPNSIITIEIGSFGGCSSLTSLYCLNEAPTWRDSGCCTADFGYFAWLPDSTCTVYYIEGMPGWEGAPDNCVPFDPDWLWGKYEFVEDASGSYVNTSDWLGWLEVSYSPWAWHYGTGNWMYIREPVAAANCGWVYMPDISTDAPELELVMMPDCCYGWSGGLKRWLYVSPEASASHAGWVYML